ncbi:glycosyl hydrolase [Siphonobacter sp. BAB-5385]|uniref:glycosyl hydrolase n=1 Tax=Siphonobacter sp. BAB-5385 TaxID=1864822 RepID=UPI00113FFA2B|nr:glycosyl hydrolase [Siphonobacter sp. BAB-5385]
MKNSRPLFLWGLLACLWTFQSLAQAPQLPTRATLSQSLLSNRSFVNASQVDTVVKFHPLSVAYTLEIAAKVNSATGRGLDMEARNSELKGFRLSLNPTQLQSTASLANAATLSTSQNSQQQLIRVAVSNGQAHIYQNGTFLQTQPLSVIRDIVNGQEVNDAAGYNEIGDNLIANWAGTTPNNLGSPSDYGWVLSNVATGVTIFNRANASSGSRFMDASNHSQNYNSVKYQGRIFYVRTDNDAIKDALYAYPVNLEANTTYNFTMLSSYLNNATGGRNITVGIGKTTKLADRYSSRVISTQGQNALKKDNFVFTSREAGTYYLTLTGDRALYSVAELQIKKVEIQSRFIFGKNYPTGAVDMEISSVTYEEGAFAPTSTVPQPMQTVNLTDRVVKASTTFNTKWVIPGATDFHLTAENTPFVNSTIELQSDEAWVFFDNIRPAQVIANYLDKITINGASAANNPSVRVAIYGNGTVVIPNGNQTSQAALQAFTQENLQGTNRTFAIETYHNKLDTFDNAIKSFKLKRGYMATLATNADGSGFSRVFIANDADLVINNLPEALNATTSFIRVFKWDWISKKGKAGWSPDKINATWYYDWNIGGAPAANYDYTIIRQNAGWPSWEAIRSKPMANHLLGFNEPDRPDQANMTVEEAIRQWPEMMKSGHRIGSPAPASPGNSWITNFMSKCNELNYRVDFVAIHCYWGGQTPQQWYSQLKSIYDRVKRPLWITEWNNGANWTTEAWPDDQNAQFQKQYNDMIGILNVLDTTSFVERYAIYDWVQNKRAMVLGDTLTPAGKYYAANKSDLAFDPRYEYIHTWKLSSPQLYSAVNADNNRKVTLSWNDLNGELGSKYVLERKIDGTDADFVSVQEFTGYAPGDRMTFEDDVRTKTTYRIKAYSRSGTQTVNSTTLDVISDASPQAPTNLAGEVISASRIKLTWMAPATLTRGYNLKRSLSPEGPFTTVAEQLMAREFTNENLTPATTYYYVVTSLNSAGESPASTVLSIATPALVAPSGVGNPRVASSDAKAILTWDFAYDVTYDILRSEEANGTFNPIATQINAVRYEDINRQNGKTYYYKVVARNAEGSSPASELLTATPKAGQHVHLSFNENTGIAAYDDWGGYHAQLKDGATWTDGVIAPNDIVTRATTADGKNTAVALSSTGRSYLELQPGVVSTLSNFTIATWVKLPANLANNTRLFDFGTGTGTFMILVPKARVVDNVAQSRYKIMYPGGNYDVYFPNSIPTDQWVHLALTQQGTTFKFFVNGNLVFTDQSATVKPMDMGVTNRNYLGRSQWPNDPYSDHVYDDFKIFNTALADNDVNALANERSLPVTLVSFEGKAANEGNYLTWRTAQELNNDHFVLERSLDTPRNFQAIARIKGQGTTARPSDYQYFDTQAQGRMAYYQLVQKDTDGKTNISRMIAVDNRTLRQLKAYPNPVADVLTVELPDRTLSSVKVRLLNTAGQVVYEHPNYRPKEGTVQLDMSRLPLGVYHLLLTDVNESYHVNVIKK